MRSKAQIQTVLALALVVTDAAMAGLAFLLAYLMRRWIPWPSEAQGMGGFPSYSTILIAHVLSILAVFAFYRLYRPVRSGARVDEFYGVSASTTVGTLMGVAISSLLFKNSPIELDYSRGVILYAWILTIILVMVGRLIHGLIRGRLNRSGVGRDRVLVVGTGDVARMICQKIQSNPGLGYEVVGFVAANGQEGSPVCTPVLGHASDLAQIIADQRTDEVIIALPEATHEEVLALISECERGQVTIKVFPDLFQIMASQVSIGDLGGLPLLTVRDIALRGWRRTAKRSMDIAISAAALVLISPLLMLTALLIKLDSDGPVFYAQERTGLDARPFLMLKFRSMRQDAERSGPGWTVKSDPRVTRLGRTIRRLNIDELPQFINVLLGDMSMVGPRPERPVYVEQFRRAIPRYMERHLERGGVTGWAQVNGLRGDTSIAERIKYDLWYVENWSLLLDVKIIVRTAFQFFRSPNAY
jgi:exopolysaccharide biosynthesis polyprenyl glycosylphosphotransferase